MATAVFRSGEDEIAISTNDTFNSKFTTTGFGGDGTATAQFHTFKSTVGDDVIIENTEADRRKTLFCIGHLRHLR